MGHLPVFFLNNIIFNKHAIPQNQQKYDGIYNVAQAFAGKLDGINLLKMKLTEEQVIEIYSRGRNSPQLPPTLSSGAILTWRDILNYSPSGEAKFEDNLVHSLGYGDLVW